VPTCPVFTGPVTIVSAYARITEAGFKRVLVTFKCYKDSTTAHKSTTKHTKIIVYIYYKNLVLLSKLKVRPNFMC